MVVSLVPEEAILLWTRELKKKRKNYITLNSVNIFPNLWATKPILHLFENAIKS